MKKVFYAAASLLFCLFISCNDATKTNTSADTQNEKNREHSLAVYKGIESGDMSVMDEFLAEDAVDHASMGDIKGRDSIKRMLSDIHNHFTNMKLELIAEGTSSSGDYHFALTRMTGTTKDAVWGMPANTNVDQTSVDVIKLVNGKATEHWGFEDPKMAMKMMNMNKGNEPAMKKMDDKMMEKKDSLPKK